MKTEVNGDSLYWVLLWKRLKIGRNRNMVYCITKKPNVITLKTLIFKRIYEILFLVAENQQTNEKTMHKRNRKLFSSIIFLIHAGILRQTIAFCH